MLRLNKVLLLLLAIAPVGCHQLDDVDTGENEKMSPGQHDVAHSDTALLRDRILELGVHTPDPGVVLPLDDPKVKLGQALFFDKIVSGDQTLACSTCHHPAFGTSDGLPTAIGVGGADLGPQRAASSGFVIPRNSPDLFNRGIDLWSTMFWDARVSAAAGYFASPAGSNLPSGLDSVLAVQAMFPPTSRHEMRGEVGENELADVPDSQLNDIWDGITERLLAVDGYVLLFEAAYPDVAVDDIGFEHAANAMAAFEVSAFTRINAPFDQFMAGDDHAMSADQLRGAELFFQDGGCVSCHSGPLFTDQKSYAIGSPQLGPGKNTETRSDFGRMLETGEEADKYAFRTPPLRNVELTGPYMHSGAYATLEDAIRHHITPAESLRDYRGNHLTAAHAGTVLLDSGEQDAIANAIDPGLAGCGSLTNDDVNSLVAFLQSLTDESARDMSNLIPTSVPSGLPVE
jgi:cytochrome c peroxidase